MFYAQSGSTDSDTAGLHPGYRIVDIISFSSVNSVSSVAMVFRHFNKLP